MNHDPVQPPDENGLPTPQQTGWPIKRMVIFAVAVLIAQIAFILFLGEKSAPPTRPTKDVQHFQLAEDSSSLIALDDPTLFALPHTHDFAADLWLGPVAVPPPQFAWTEDPRWLPLSAQELGLNLRLFLDTNVLAIAQPVYKPEPSLAEPVAPLAPQLTQQTVMHVYGELADRALLGKPALPAITNIDLVAHSHVQALVNAAGDVISVITLPPGSLVVLPEDSGGSRIGDDLAQQLVRQLHFAPSGSPAMFGQFIFDWHTVTTNAPAAATSP